MSSETVAATAAILYCDGGFQPDSKISGWGVHGYTYVDEAPKKGTGNPKAIPSDIGYIFGERAGNKVTIVQYVDIIAGKRDAISSNEVELYALYDAVKWLKNHKYLKKVLILSDSRYAVQGTMNHLSNWVRHGWLNSKGKPVQHQGVWEKIHELIDEVKAAGMDLKLDWIKSHEGEPGNTKADLLAWKGKVLAQNNNTQVVTSLKNAQGYWAPKSAIPRILQAPRWYFSTVDMEYKREDGSHLYCVGSHGTKDKENDLFGKMYADNFLGVVSVKDPDPVMECLRLNAIAKDPKHIGSLVIGMLDTIFTPKTYNELADYNTTFLYSNPKRIDLLDSQKREILVELKPAGLGYRGVDQWRYLTKVLDGVVAGDERYTLTDVTNLLYEQSEAKKPVRKLKATITQITKCLDVPVQFNLQKKASEPKPFTDKIRLILGADILSRNQLAALAEDVKSVQVVTWRESDNVGRYATMVELLSTDKGIWARTEANLYYRMTS